MKQLPLLLAALLATACAQATRPDNAPILLPEPCPALPEGQRYHYENAAPDFCRQLHEACRRCACIEFNHGGHNSADTLRVSRAEAGPALAHILRIQHWQARSILINGHKRASHPSPIPLIRFLDADVNELLALPHYPSGPGYAPQPEGRAPLSLWNIFSAHMRRPAPHP